MTDKRFINRQVNTLHSLAVLFLITTFLSCSPEKETKRPNILFCIADDVSFPHMGAYGTSWVKTPAFDRVASQGILFMNAYTPNAKCAPSRSCILTGRNSWQLEEAANHFPEFPLKFKTFMETLEEQGYFTGHTAKGWAPGRALDKDGNRRLLTGKAFNDKKLDPPTKHISNNDYAANFSDFLAAKPDDQPFCFWYGSLEPHRAYEFGSSLAHGRNNDEIDRVFSFWPDTDSVRTDMLDYAFEIEWFDKHLGQMLQTLEEMGELENTIIVITADNGMPFPRAKGQAYELSNHLPLAIMWPAGIRSKGRTVTDFVSFIDFAPTFLELAGVSSEKSVMQPIQGKSLSDILFSDQEGIVNPSRDHVLIGKERHDVGRPDDQGYPIRGIVKGNYLYVKNYETDRWPVGNPETGYLNTDGGATKTVILNMRRNGINDEYWKYCFGKRMDEELYDLSIDRDCMNNMALNPEYQQIVQSLREQMEEELNQQQDPRMKGNGHIFDEYTYTNPNNVNFYNRFMAGDEVEANWVNKTDFEKEKIK
ncbi:MAG: sulfatase [Cyclobacteriaceae bacterium]|nr:sulfatase [Cyclobacteriaceae bacterium]